MPLLCSHHCKIVNVLSGFLNWWTQLLLSVDLCLSDFIGQMNKHLSLGPFIRLCVRDANVLCKRQYNRSMFHLRFTFIGTAVWTCIHCSLCGLINLIIAQHAQRGREDCVGRVITLRECFSVSLYSYMNYYYPLPLLHPYHINLCTNKYLPPAKTHICVHTSMCLCPVYSLLCYRVVDTLFSYWAPSS